MIILQHGEYEPAGTIGDYLEIRHKPYLILRLDEGDPVPCDPPRHLVVLGGQMSANDESTCPFLSAEKTLLRKAIGHKSVVLGICLGAQLIAASCGKPVYNGEQELGWRVIHGQPAVSAPWNQLFPASFGVFQWHKETFDLPEGATLLATGTEVKNQAFMLGHALGLQFHPEVTLPVITHWARDLAPDQRVAIVKESKKIVDANQQLCTAIMDAFCSDWGRQEWNP